MSFDYITKHRDLDDLVTAYNKWRSLDDLNNYITLYISAMEEQSLNSHVIENNAEINNNYIKLRVPYCGDLIFITAEIDKQVLNGKVELVQQLNKKFYEKESYVLYYHNYIMQNNKCYAIFTTCSPPSPKDMKLVTNDDETKFDILKSFMHEHDLIMDDGTTIYESNNKYYISPFDVTQKQ